MSQSRVCWRAGFSAVPAVFLVSSLFSVSLLFLSLLSFLLCLMAFIQCGISSHTESLHFVLLHPFCCHCAWFSLIPFSSCLGTLFLILLGYIFSTRYFCTDISTFCVSFFPQSLLYLPTSSLEAFPFFPPSPPPPPPSLAPYKPRQ